MAVRSDLSDLDVRRRIFERFVGRLSPTARKERLRGLWDDYRRNAIRHYSRGYFDPDEVIVIAEFESRILQRFADVHGDDVIRALVIGISDRMRTKRSVFNDPFSEF